mgnify:FL=1
MPVEVIPISRSSVAREFIKIGGRPVLRQEFTTDNGNIILDVHDLNITEPLNLEKTLNNIPGVVTNGLFAINHAHILLCANDNEIEASEPIV